MPLFDTSNLPGAQQPITPESLENIITKVYIPETLRQDLELIKTTINMSQKDANRLYGTLFKGPPGTGKTVLAKLITKESGALFYNASKVNSEYLKRIFSEARKKAKEGNKVVIFIDEIDGLGMERSAALMNVGESKESLHVLLTELSEKEKNKGITVIAATNKPEILDPALMRPERLGFNIDFPVPNYKDRVEIMKVVSKLPQDVIKSIADKTQGYTPADLVHVISLANTFREHNKRTKISDEDIQFALRKSSPSGLAGLLSYEPKITIEDVVGKDVMKKVITSVLKTSPAADYFVFYGLHNSGKRYMAEAIAGTLEKPFVEVTPDQIFRGVVGTTEERIRQVITRAVYSNALLFIPNINGLVGYKAEGWQESFNTVLRSVMLDAKKEHNGEVVIVATVSEPYVQIPSSIKTLFDHFIYFDIPSKDEQKLLWQQYIGEYGGPSNIGIEDVVKANPTLLPGEIAQACKHMREIIGAGATTEHYESIASSYKRRTPDELKAIKDGFKTVMDRDSVDTYTELQSLKQNLEGAKK